MGCFRSTHPTELTQYTETPTATTATDGFHLSFTAWPREKEETRVNNQRCNALPDWPVPAYAPDKNYEFPQSATGFYTPNTNTGRLAERTAKTRWRQQLPGSRPSAQTSAGVRGELQLRF
jgi:hypothetical protein